VTASVQRQRMRKGIPRASNIVVADEGV
jgi:hypothetical protein